MPFWKKFSGKKPSALVEIITDEEYRALMLQIARAGDRYGSAFSIATAAVQRFDPSTIDSNLEEAKRVQGPISLIIEATAIANRRIAYCGGADLKQRIGKLVIVDRNLHHYSEFHRQAGDALFNQGKLSVAVSYYLTALRFRPRLSYLRPDGSCLTPPELEGFAWPQILDQKGSRKQNIRLTPDFMKDSQILAFLYARLGRCLSPSHNKHGMADEAFKICFWFLEKLGSKANLNLIATIHSMIGESLFERGDNEGAIANFEKANSIWQAINNQFGLAKSLIYLGESHLRLGKPEIAYDLLRQALDVSKRLGRQDFIHRIEELLPNAPAQRSTDSHKGSKGLSRAPQAPLTRGQIIDLGKLLTEAPELAPGDKIAVVECPKCGFLNPLKFRNCVRCKEPLS